MLFLWSCTFLPCIQFPATDWTWLVLGGDPELICWCSAVEAAASRGLLTSTVKRQSRSFSLVQSSQSAALLAPMAGPAVPRCAALPQRFTHCQHSGAILSATRGQR